MPTRCLTPPGMLIPASEVSSDQLSGFFGRIPDGEQAFLKENIRDPETGIDDEIA